MKRGITVLIVFILLITIFAPFVSAEEATETAAPTEKRKLKEKIVEKVKARITEKKENLIENIKDKLGRVLHFGARITGNLTAVSTTSLTVQVTDEKIYTVDVTNARCLRRFGGKCEWSELAVGDKVNVVGKWTDENKTAITAKLVRDASIQKRFGVLFGKILTKSDSSFTMEVKRGKETLTATVYTTGAKFINRKEETISYGDILVGHRVRVKGIWDRIKNTINEVKEVKDFTLPLQPKTTLTPASTLTTTPTE